jgi:hypothetical protein
MKLRNCVLYLHLFKNILQGDNIQKNPSIQSEMILFTRLSSYKGPKNAKTN